jgi:hypothetical protein
MRRDEVYPANLARMIDPVPILGLQNALRAEGFELRYFKGTVSYQRERIPSEVRRTGRLGEGRVRIIHGTLDKIEYEWGSRIPRDSEITTQGDIQAEIVEALGLERIEEALGINIKERITMPKVPKRLEDLEPFQGYEHLEHRETAAGDYTGVISKALNFPKGLLRSIPEFVREELVSWGIVKAKDKVLVRIRSPLRTVNIKPVGGEVTPLIPYMTDLHRELIVPHKWQDVGIPDPVRMQNGFTTPINALMYRLFKRKYLVAVQLPEELFTV